jgi:4-diphosphocytidyl-2-C-methyl-D-erythritol kinase
VSPSRFALTELAPAKVNLTLRVGGRRRDGYHTIASLVAFASLHDRLTFVPGGRLKLTSRGPTAAAAGNDAANLVLKAARALAAEVDGLELGGFILFKQLPVAAGLGGGSADGAAALRLLARANRLKRSDPRLRKAARALGADVPVCLDPKPRLMRGIGEILSAPLRIPKIPAVLVNPGVALSTRDVFKRYDRRTHRAKTSRKFKSPPRKLSALIAMLASENNDLEPAAIALAPAVEEVLAMLRNLPSCRLARMSGAGTTCFGIFATARAAKAAARKLKASHPRWWVRTTTLG